MIKLKTVTVDELKFKKKLSMIEQFTLKDFLFKWVGRPPEGLDDFLPLEYIESVFPRMEAKQVTTLLINGDEHFRYATITEENQIVIGVLDSNKELKHRIISLDEVLIGKHL
ncbi:hypothetical protein [Neobacillus massiliamazoniensis]|uniref:Uncharacterized protein n=1 Tax=Neobacillus massiliamazoniensis TaxID=1499688 RepID=A0A0U1P2U4_9BACI|nr:hypothetical protein [Neobacillus massiliamazoniensis]CRK84570.1 hypothetical protein BN000_04610 [Neobacillus massiliamazoniensis]